MRSLQGIVLTGRQLAFACLALEICKLFGADLVFLFVTQAAPCSLERIAGTAATFVVHEPKQLLVCRPFATSVKAAGFGNRLSQAGGEISKRFFQFFSSLVGIIAAKSFSNFLRKLFRSVAHDFTQRLLPFYQSFTHAAFSSISGPMRRRNSFSIASAHRE